MTNRSAGFGIVFVASCTTALITMPATAWAQTYTYRDIGTLGGSECIPLAMNSSGAVAGISQDRSGAFNAFVYQPNVNSMKALGVYGLFTSMGLSDLGHVAVNTQLPGAANTEHAARWTPSAGANTLVGTLTELPTVNGLDWNWIAEGQAVNSLGTVAGWVSITSPTTSQRAAIWPRGSTLPTVLPPLTSITLSSTTSVAHGISDTRTAVGRADVPALRNGLSATSRAVAWFNGGAPRDLGSLGGTYSEAFAIDPAGTVIVGASTTAKG